MSGTIKIEDIIKKCNKYNISVITRQNPRYPFRLKKIDKALIVLYDKILIICEVLEVTPYDLLSGAEHTGNRSRTNDTYVISKGTDIGALVESYQQLSTEQQKRLMGYLDAIKG